MGWVERDAIWLFAVEKGKVETIRLNTGARYTTLHTAGTDLFAAVHHFEGRRFELTVRSFRSPEIVLGRATVDSSGTELTGGGNIWRDVPRLYADTLAFAPWNDFVLLDVAASTGRVGIQRFAWFDGSYDKVYQGIVQVLELKQSDSALVSVQRSSSLVLHDLKTGLEKSKVRLASRGGNPQLRIANSGTEIWASDCDTLVVLDSENLRVKRSSRLQDAPGGARQFLGDYSFTSNGDLCVVARPFSGDVIGVDPKALTIVSSAKVGRQPLEAIVLGNNQVIARDWKTGTLVKGTLRPE